jgi:hypothetical protein
LAGLTGGVAKAPPDAATRYVFTMRDVPGAVSTLIHIRFR